jgi:hypothetical protein
MLPIGGDGRVPRDTTEDQPVAIYVLIILISGYQSLAVTTVEFETRNACLAAARAFTTKVQGEDPDNKVVATCAAKR